MVLGKQIGKETFMSTIEQKWINKYAKIGQTNNDEFQKFQKTARVPVTKRLAQCLDCDWVQNGNSALEPDVHSYLTGHTIIITTVTTFKRQQPQSDR